MRTKPFFFPTNQQTKPTKNNKQKKQKNTYHKTNPTHLFSVTLNIFLFIFNCCCAWTAFMTGVCKCSQGWILLANTPAESRVCGWGRVADVAFQNQRFLCILQPAHQSCMCNTRRHRAARQHSFYFHNSVVARCKILLPPPAPHQFSCRPPEPSQNVSDKLFAVSIFTELYLCGCAPVSLLKASQSNGVYL